MNFVLRSCCCEYSNQIRGCQPYPGCHSRGAAWLSG